MAKTEIQTEQLRQEVDRNTWWNMFLLVTVVLLMTGFIVYQYWQFKKFTRPENLVALSEERIEKTYPELRAMLKKQALEAAPELAAQLRKKTIRSMPMIREDLVEFLGRQLAVGLDEVTDLSADEFREILKENRQLVLDAVNEVKEFPDRAEKFVVGLEEKLEARWDADVQKKARFLVRSLHQFNDKLERLSKDEQLTPEDMLARRIVRIVRAIQEKQLGG